MKRRALQKEAVASFENNNFEGFGLIPTGTGKAWILAEIIKKVKPKSCWYLCDSTKNRDETFINELIKWGAGEWVDKIEFMCYQTAYKLKGFKVDLLLADEADFSLTKKYSNVYYNNDFKHRILVSGTLAPEKYAILRDIEVPLVHNIEIHEIEEDGVLNKANYHIVNFMLNKSENYKYLNFNRTFARLLSGFHSRKEMEMLQINRKHFLSGLESSVNVCRKLMKHLYEKDESNKMLIFCGLSDQADKVCKYSYHSKNDGAYFKQFDEGKIRALSVVAKADRGLNIVGVNNIIMESPTKSSTKFLQRTGRGRRLHVDDELDVYFLIPYYVDQRGKTKPTIVHSWVYDAASKLKDFRPKIYKF